MTPELGSPLQPSGPPWRLLVGSLSDVGQIRVRNEDSLHVEPPWEELALRLGWLGLVADGLGGRPGGDVASRTAAHALREAYYGDGPAAPAERLRQAVEQANLAVFNLARQTYELQGMATTLTAAVLHGVELTLAQVGDTRAYLLRDDDLHQLTQDHSWVAEAERAGLLSHEQALKDPRRNLVTRVLGSAERVEVDVSQIELRPGDRLLLCSDGLHGQVGDGELESLLRLTDDPQLACDRLVALANQRGGPDNITVLVAMLEPLEAAAEQSEQPATAAPRGALPALGPAAVAPAAPVDTTAEPAIGRPDPRPAAARPVPDTRAAWSYVAIAVAAAALTFWVLVWLETVLTR